MHKVSTLTLRADNSVLRSFGMGDRCSFFQVAIIELILRNTLNFACSCRIQGVSCDYSNIFCSVTQISQCLYYSACTNPLRKIFEYSPGTVLYSQCFWVSAHSMPCERLKIYHPSRNPSLWYYLHLIQIFNTLVNTVSNKRKYTLASKSITQKPGGLEEKEGCILPTFHLIPHSLEYSARQKCMLSFWRRLYWKVQVNKI